MATKVKEEIKAILSRPKFIRPSIDEWQDASHRRYIGETIYSISEEEWKLFTVSLKQTFLIQLRI